MSRISRYLPLIVALFLFHRAAAQKELRVIAFYTPTVEKDHVDFAHDAIQYFEALAQRKHFVFDTTSVWADLKKPTLKSYQLVIWINEFPHTEEERRAFEDYINSGGAWLGFHVSGYNDKDTHWPWFVDFMGGAVFYNNNWPPLPAKLKVDNREHPVTKGLPESYESPTNEWYQWRPSPRLNKDVLVLVTLDPSNYPLGKKNLLTEGDIPVVWTNTKYHMVYMNMGHGNKVMTSPIQNGMIENAVEWLGNTK